MVTRNRSRRAGLVGVLLTLGLGLTGCFNDHFSEPDDDDDETAAPTTKGDDVTPTSTDGTTGTDGEDTDGDASSSSGSTTGIGEDESSEGDTTEGITAASSSSTGPSEDETTGEPALGIDDLGPGDLVVTEVMWNPHCTGDNCEWIEVLNATDSPVNLVDLFIQDNEFNAGNQGRITSDLIVPPGEVVVIARGLSSWPYSFDPDAIYGPNPGLNNGSPDRVVLLNNVEILDQTSIFPLDAEQGVAYSLSGSHLDADSNDSSNYWCDALDPLDAITTTEFGSPGVLNPSC